MDPSFRPRRPYHGDHWEYLVRTISTGDSQSYETELNRLGEEGWELFHRGESLTVRVQSQYQHGDQGFVRHEAVHTFKRRAEREAPPPLARAVPAGDPSSGGVL